ncbi:hypothetical protein DLAC_00512 [Tieghemostelium lacteum]|uniref:Cysteine and histidine-rich domain-containing protein n=1 Tax=Tieghemostelium lacteum TaxID=361077 RepID=A0A152A9X4_TIELA|nr:hypothetical protein DLAC_00512 [Tieghemostelium lacteum]|eukprot:KYR03023.1 hypothetical protein DLAC_00512 [Tieghemostelium lacteum]
MVKCGNNGCNMEFDKDLKLKDDGSHDDRQDCCFHPGSPVFHEGYKGWSCCKKRVVEFDEFLKIPGCTIGVHQEKEKTTPQPKPQPSSTETITVTNNNNNSNNNSVPLPKPTVAKKLVPVKIEYVETNDPEDAIIAENAKCTRNGCNYHYKDESSKTEVCQYHPGEPVFHEGSKGWSCCKPKAAIFEEFLKIKGCKSGKHKFIPEKKDENMQPCRHDWYQSFEYINLSIYAKGVIAESSVIEFPDNKSLLVNLQLPNDKYFKKLYNFANTFSIEKSKFDILKTKLEVKLYKDPQEAWSKLEDSELDLFRYQV